MIKIDSQTDKRLIVKGALNNKDAYMLIDTGATAGLIDKAIVKKYGLLINKNHTVNLVGAGGKFTAYTCNTPFVIGGKQMYQFLIADIDAVADSIERQTGIRIQGLISLPQAKMVQMEIDTDDNYISIG